MLSIPPATTISASPNKILCAPKCDSFHSAGTNLIDSGAINFVGQTCKFAACRAGAWPKVSLNHTAHQHIIHLLPVLHLLFPKHL